MSWQRARHGKDASRGREPVGPREIALENRRTDRSELTSGVSPTRVVHLAEAGDDDAEFQQAVEVDHSARLRRYSGTWSFSISRCRLAAAFQVLSDLKHEQPGLPVVVLSMHAEDEYAIRALRNGASGYVTKESAPEELIAAIQRVTRGGRYMTPALAEKIGFAMASPSTQAPHHILSERELEVLQLIAAGKSLKEIAALLSLSVKSVGTYRARVLEKMNMSTNADLIRYVIEHNLRL